MAKKIKITVSCDRCDTEVTISDENKSRYGMFPKNWGDLKSASLRKLLKENPVICERCIQSLKEWIEQK